MWSYVDLLVLLTGDVSVNNRSNSVGNGTGSRASVVGISSWLGHYFM